jgi:hypothetical protein
MASRGQQAPGQLQTGIDLRLARSGAEGGPELPDQVELRDPQPRGQRRQRGRRLAEVAEDAPDLAEPRETPGVDEHGSYRMWNLVLATRPSTLRQRYQAETSFSGTQRRSSLR